MNTTCLIIDDEKLARDLLREFLESFPQIDVIGESAKGSEAVEKINKLKPDLIFLDVQMPGMNGFDVLDEIDHEPHVIFTTAYDQYAIRAFEKNAVDYLLKPLDEIIFLEASGDYTVITTKNDQFVSSSGIGKLEEILNPDTFIRVHRSTIINLNFLKEIERHFNGGMVVKMQNGKSFPVSRTYAKLIRKKVV